MKIKSKHKENIKNILINKVIAKPVDFKKRKQKHPQLRNYKKNNILHLN